MPCPNFGQVAQPPDQVETALIEGAWGREPAGA